MIVDHKGEIRTRAANGRLRGALEGAGRERHKGCARVLVFESCKNRRHGLREGERHADAKTAVVDFIAGIGLPAVARGSDDGLIWSPRDFWVNCVNSGFEAGFV